MKNYVREYKGHEVPEGAEEFGPSNEDNGFDRELFYKNNGAMVFIPKGTFHGGEWRNTNTERKDLIPLPEAPQEWNGEGLPTVGVECIINITEDVWGLSDQELKLNGEKVSVISSVKNKQGFDVTVFEISDGGVFCFSSKLFRPLKTQQEKDREAFIDSVNGVFSDGEFDRHDLVLIAAKLFEERFTAPKAADNE